MYQRVSTAGSVAASLFVWMALAAPAAAQDKYPSRPVTVIVPQAAGGANDVIARIVIQRLSEVMGAQFVVDNRAGAGGNIGTAAVSKSKSDGYTLMLTTSSVMVINPWLYKNTGFDPIKNFEPIAPAAAGGYLLVANPGFPASSIKELVAYAKPKPGAITIASAGNGTMNHLIGEMLQKAAGVDFVHVPYKGAAAAATDVVSGQVPISVQSVPSVIGFINSGRLKVLATSNEKRIAILPNVPTVGETIPGFGTTPWYGFFAPAGTPKEIVAALHAAVDKTLDNKEVREKLAAQGFEIMKGTPAQFGAMMKDELPKWAKIVKESGATLD
jgi:tripartite-type tricarboxylate transporter receptor subunit TctC